VLHPQHRTKYWIKASWPSNWINTATQMARQVYDNQYASMTTSGEEIASRSTTPSAKASPLHISFKTLQVSK
jgi:hypothetical protein